ncbi:hypothetical protein TWF281_007676 [Arthrobotrys megalospora]
METFQLLDLDPPKTNITSLPLELLENISLHVGKAKFQYSWNLCTANRYLYDTIGPSNNFLWYEIVGRFELAKTKFIKYHPDFHYATLARRKSVWPDPKCCGCELAGESLKMIQNWTELRATDPVLQHFFSSHPALNSICHVYWNRRSELVSKELYNHVKSIFNIDAREPFRILTDQEIKDLQEQAGRFTPTFIPAESHRHVHDRKYLEGVIDIYRREYTSFHFLCSPAHFEELWSSYDRLMRKLDRANPPLEHFEDRRMTGFHGPRLAFNYFRYNFHKKPRRRSSNEMIDEGDYQSQLSEYEGQKAIITRHKYCQQVLVNLFGPGDGIAWRASRVQWPEFLMALFNQWHKASFGSGLWLPNQPMARCPYCYGFFQGSVGGDTSTKDLWRSEPKNLLDHIMDEHRGMLC